MLPLDPVYLQMCLFSFKREEKEALPESCQTFDVAVPQTSGLVTLVLSYEAVFFFRVRASVY